MAVRAREFAVPTAAELAQAEADIVIVRRHYVPTTPLTAGNRRRPDEPKDTGAESDDPTAPPRGRERRGQRS